MNLSETQYILLKNIWNYDDLNRLLDAEFYKQGANQNSGAYGEHLAYDLNGNITKLKRTTADALGEPVDMDDLTYAYKNNKSNILLNVTDAVSNQDTGGFTNKNVNPNLDDYEYDANGNMIVDRAKGIESITYNYMNLPEKITFSNNQFISYTYNAAGVKLKKHVKDGNEQKDVDYLDGFQYAGGRLQFFPHPEGYVKATARNASGTIFVFNYVYNYTDHLGNVRLSYTQDPKTGALSILDEDHYYPFGLRHEVYVPPLAKNFTFNLSEHTLDINFVKETEYLYKYNGKELQDELNLNLYDYGWRNYDPALGRWFNVDPLAEEFYGASPYNYVANDPIGQADFDGRDYRIDVTRDKDNNIIGLHFSATVYIQGSGASVMKAYSLNKEFDKNYGGTVDVDGIAVSVSVNYVYDEGKTERDLKAGENLLSFSSEIFDKNGKPLSSYVIGNKGTIYNSGNSSRTIFHESFHFMGLTDRYDDYRECKMCFVIDRTPPHSGFESDIMGRGFLLNKIHYENWAKHAKQRASSGKYFYDSKNPFSPFKNESYFETSKSIDKNSKGLLEDTEGNWYKRIDYSK